LWRKKASGSESGLRLKAALDYGRLGWSVIPIEPRGKRPLVRWQVYEHRRAEIPEIGDWFRRWPDANIAVVTGVVSGIVVLDLDPRQGADKSLHELQRPGGTFVETIESLTGEGRRHLYFAHPGDITPTRIGMAPGVDLRGDGDYVVAPPSLHATGESYHWIHSPEVMHLVQPPPWLLQLAFGPDVHHGAPPIHWRRLLRDGAAEGARRASIASLAGHLLGAGVDRDVAAELLVCWNALRCRPPLDEAEVLRTVESIYRMRDEEQGAPR
jgi:hypothetical protein